VSSTDFSYATAASYVSYYAVWSAIWAFS